MVCMKLLHCLFQAPCSSPHKQLPQILPESLATAAESEQFQHFPPSSCFSFKQWREHSALGCRWTLWKGDGEAWGKVEGGSFKKTKQTNNKILLIKKQPKNLPIFSHFFQSHFCWFFFPGKKMKNKYGVWLWGKNGKCMLSP